MIIIYSVIFLLSLLAPVGYLLYIKRKQNEHWLFLLFISVAVVNLGYLLLAVSRTVSFALVANKVAYLGQTVVPLCMLMIISRLSGVVYKKWARITLFVAAALMYSLVLTTGHLDWYYSSVELVYEGGAARLVKEYGPLHLVNLFYVLFYFVAMLATAIFSLGHSRGESRKLSGLMLAVVIGNVGMWIVEKLVTFNFEFLSVSYIMSELVFFFVYWMLQDLSPRTEEMRVAEKLSVIYADSKERAERISAIIASLPEGASLTPRQMDILEGILDGKSRKEIAFDLHLSENTVKMHTTALFKILRVTSRDEIFALIKR